MNPDLIAILSNDSDGYRIVETLSPASTFLCEDAVGHRVVLKRMEDDCLPGGKLHPQIRDRLSRVRELAHLHVATLRTVERWNGSTYLVWTYLDGNTFGDLQAVSLLLMARLAATVDTLHRAGITHGNLHGQNIIVTSDQQVWLTDVSPYLYFDPAVDVAAVRDLLMSTAKLSPDDQSPAVHSILQNSQSLKDISHRLSALDGGLADEAAMATAATSARYRIRSLLAAAGAGALGIGCWLALHAAASKALPAHPIPFPSLRP